MPITELVYMAFRDFSLSNTHSALAVLLVPRTSLSHFSTHSFYTTLTGFSLAQHSYDMVGNLLFLNQDADQRPVQDPFLHFVLVILPTHPPNADGIFSFQTEITDECRENKSCVRRSL